MENEFIKSKGNIVHQLWALSPSLAIGFLITTIAAFLLIALTIISKYNPGLFNKIFDRAGIAKTNNGNCDKCVKDDMLIIKNDLKDVIEYVKNYFNPKERQERIDRVDKMLKDTAITAGIGTIYTDNVPFADFCTEILKYWRNEGNGNSLEQVKKRIMENHENLKTWRSKVNEDHLENGEGSRHFEECLKAIRDFIG